MKALCYLSVRATTKSIALIGPNAYPAVPVGGGSGRVEPFVSTSFLQGLSGYLGTSVPVYYARGVPSLSEMAQVTNFLTAPTEGKPRLMRNILRNKELKGTPAIKRIDETRQLPRRNSLGLSSADAVIEVERLTTFLKKREITTSS